MKKCSWFSQAVKTIDLFQIAEYMSYNLCLPNGRSRFSIQQSMSIDPELRR